MKPLKKISIIVILSSAISSLIIATPSYGFSLIDTFFNSIKNEIQGEWTEIQTLTLNEISKLWAAGQEDARNAINSAVGVMGEPDPITSSEQLKNVIASKSSWSVAQAQSQQLQRSLIKASVSAQMNQQGQQYTANKINETTSTAQDATDLAQQAQGMTASQDILKVMAAQNSQIVSMLAQQRTDSLESRQDIAGSNLMLTQIAEQLALTHQQEEINEKALVAYLHENIPPLDPSYIP